MDWTHQWNSTRVYPWETIEINIGGSDVCFVSKIYVQGVSIDNNFCSAVVDMGDRSILWTGYIFKSHYRKLQLLVCVFTSRQSIDITEKIQERALRFGLQNLVSGYGFVLEKTGYEGFSIRAVKLLLVEMKIFTGSSHVYQSDIFEKSENSYCMRDKNKFIQPLKLMMTYGLMSFEYYDVICYLCIPKPASPFKNSKYLIWRPGYPMSFTCTYAAGVKWLCWNIVYSVQSFIQCGRPATILVLMLLCFLCTDPE